MLNLDLKRDIISLVIYAFVMAGLFIAGFYALTAGLGLTEEQLQMKYWFYAPGLLAWFLLLATVKIGQHFSKSLRKAVVFLHDIEYGMFGDNVRVVRNPILLLLLCLIVFSLFALISTSFIGSQSVVGNAIANGIFPLSVGGIQEQVTPTSSMVFTVYGAHSEDANGFILLSIIMTLLMVAAWKLDLDRKIVYFASIIPVAALFSPLWLKIHVLVSGADQVRQVGHLIYGFNSAALTLSTGSIIPASVYHLVNNFFQILRKSMGNEYIYLVFGLILVVSAIAFVLIYVYTGGKKKR
jgi:hypothetical protein